MEPKRIVQEDGFTVVGVKLRCKMGETGEIPQLWGQLMARMSEIQHVISDGSSYGVSADYDEATETWDYIAAFKVSEAGAVPEGMVSLDIAPQTYAVFSCTMPTISPVYDAIYQEWFPQSGYEHARTPEFELYGKTFDPNDPASEFEVYMPLKK